MKQQLILEILNADGSTTTRVGIIDHKRKIRPGNQITIRGDVPEGRWWTVRSTFDLPQDITIEKEWHVGGL